MKTEPTHDTPKQPTRPASHEEVEKQGVADLLGELASFLEQSPDRRTLAFVALDATLKMALDAGWHMQELVALRAWAGAGK